MQNAAAVSIAGAGRGRESAERAADGASALPVLWHFTVSHFNEKARWALDFKRLPHVRHALLPGLHFARVLRLTGQTAVPVLVLDGQAIHDSTRIIAALEHARPEPPLYPVQESDRARPSRSKTSSTRSSARRFARCWCTTSSCTRRSRPRRSSPSEWVRPAGGCCR